MVPYGEIKHYYIIVQGDGEGETLLKHSLILQHENTFSLTKQALQLCQFGRRL